MIQYHAAVTHTTAIHQGQTPAIIDAAKPVQHDVHSGHASIEPNTVPSTHRLSQAKA